MANEETPQESLIPYEDFVQDALRDVVRKLLTDVAMTGLPGRHHFFIGFRTSYPGVVMPPDLRARYPDDMTIVLQNRYWDLKVGDDRFEVGLSFNHVPTRLVVPFDALVSFVDPSVDFGLQFQPPVYAMDEPAAAPTSTVPDPSGDDDSDGDNGGGKVVSLDRFRKKP